MHEMGLSFCRVPHAETMAHDHLSHMPTADLVGRCVEETKRFFRRQEHDEAPCFELVRRALQECSEPAWECVYQLYRPLVASWVREHGQFAICAEDVDYFVNDSFQRFWHACNREHFDRFAGLRPLLAYLKACVHSAITDHLRTREVQMLQQPVALVDDISYVDLSYAGAALAVEEQVMAQDQRQVFWAMIQQRVQHEQEQAILDYQFVQGWKPREILARCGTLFTDQQEVYRVRDNLVRRLSRDPEVRAFFETGYRV